MADLAVLGTRFVTEGAEASERAMDGVANAGDRVEKSMDDAAAATKRAGKTMGDAVAPAKQFASATQRMAAEQEAAIKTAQRLNDIHGANVVNTKAMQQATLGLGRQFTDLFVQIGSGGNPFTALLQQLPQIADGLEVAKMQGIGAKEAFKGLLASVLPIAAPILAISAVAASAFAIFEREIDKNTKHATTWGDTWKAVIKVTGDYIMDGPIGDGLKWLAGAFSKTLDLIVKGVTWWYDTTVGFFIAAYNTIKSNWSNLPDVLNAIFVTAANKALAGVEFIVNGVIKGVNELRKKAGLKEFGTVDLPELEARNKKVAASFSKEWQDATNAAKASREGFFNDIAKQADKEWEKRQKGAKKAKEEIEQLAGLKPFDEDKLLKATEEVWPYMAAVIQASEKRTRDLNAATQELNHTLGTVRIPSDLENLATELEVQSSAARDLAYGVEDVARAINDNDWLSAFAGLARVLVQVQTALKNATTAQERFNAVAMAANAVGSAVGGTGGAAISGTASGAMAGFTIAGPAGAVVGGILGGIGGILGSSSAKKKARQQAAAQAAAEAAQREQTRVDTEFGLQVALLRATGDVTGALNMEREREITRLAAISQASADYQKQIWELEDATAAATKAAEEQAKADEISARNKASQRAIILDLMAMDDAVLGTNKAVLAAREDELATLDPVSKVLKEIYYARLDEGAAAQKAADAQEAAAKVSLEASDAAAKGAAAYWDKVATAGEEAARRQAEAAQALGNSFADAVNQLEDFERSLKGFAASLTGEALAGTPASVGAARASLVKAVSKGDFANVESLGRSYLELYKSAATTQADYQEQVAFVQSLALQAAAKAGDRASGYGDVFRNLPGMASGGAFTIGGNAGLDQNVLSINDTPVARVNYGEDVLVGNGVASNDNSDLAQALAALEQRLANIEAGVVQTVVNTGRGARMLDRWDGDGLPPERETA